MVRPIKPRTIGPALLIGIPVVEGPGDVGRVGRRLSLGDEHAIGIGERGIDRRAAHAIDLHAERGNAGVHTGRTGRAADLAVGALRRAAGRSNTLADGGAARGAVADGASGAADGSAHAGRLARAGREIAELVRLAGDGGAGARRRRAAATTASHRAKEQCHC